MDPKKNTAQPKKHLKSFWPLVVIFVVAGFAAGLVFWYQFNLSTDYDLQSMSTVTTLAHLKSSATSTPQAPVKTKTGTAQSGRAIQK